MWITAEELLHLPTGTPAYNNVAAWAAKSAPTPNLKNQDADTNAIYLAKALMYARHGDPKLYSTIEAGIGAITNSDLTAGARALAVARELPAYIIAADLANLASANPGLHIKFQDKLKYILHEAELIQGPATLALSSEIRPNNWGAHALAARAAVDIYCADFTDLDKTDQLFQGYCGDRTVYAGFKFGEMWWQPDPANPLAILAPGAQIDQHDLNGAQPEELRRKGEFTWPVPTDNTYPWEALQGLTVAMELLHRAGYPARDYSQKAILRAVQWLYKNNWPASGDDRWQPFLINYAYGTNFPTSTPTTPGKNMGFTDWTHDQASAPTTYTLQVTASAGGTVEIDPPGGNYLPDTSVKLTASPYNDYVFVEWSGSITGDANPITIVMTGNRFIQADFGAKLPTDDVAALKAKIADAIERLKETQVSVDLTAAAVTNLVDVVATIKEEITLLLQELQR